MVEHSDYCEVGTSSARSISSNNQFLQVEASGDYNSYLSSFTYNYAGASGPRIILCKTKGSSAGAVTLVSNGDTLGEIAFNGADGNDVNSTAALIKCEVDDTPGADDMPGRLVFSTTADGASSPTEAMRINNQQELLVGTATRTANGGKLQLSSGITFPATAVAASNANTLDDYEEGTWTPVVSFGGASVGITGVFSGIYTKIGNVVTVTFRLAFTSKGSSTGNMLVSGMPFNAGGGNETISGFGYAHRFAFLQVAGQMYLALDGTDIYPRFFGYNAVNTTTLTNTDIGNDTDLRAGTVFRV